MRSDPFAEMLGSRPRYGTGQLNSGYNRRSASIVKRSDFQWQRGYP